MSENTICLHWTCWSYSNEIDWVISKRNWFKNIVEVYVRQIAEELTFGRVPVSHVKTNINKIYLFEH